MHLEPARRGATITAAVFALIGLGLVLASRSLAAGTGGLRSQDVHPLSTGMVVFGVALLVLGLVGATVNARRWRLHARLVKISTDPQFADLTPPDDTVARAAVDAVPELCVNHVRTRRLPSTPPLRVVSRNENVVGEPPPRIGYLRLFENLPRTRTFVEGAWREFGHVLMLRSAGAVTPRELRAVKSGHPASVFLTTPEAIAAQLDAEPAAPSARGRRVFTGLGHQTIRTRDRYGAYAPVAPLCHGSVWRRGVDLVLERVDVVVLDLSGFSPRNDGTAWELQRVIDRYPVERVVVIVDPRSDVPYLEGVIRRAWEQMATGSPNAHGTERTLVVATTDEYRHIVVASNSGTGAYGQQFNYAPGTTVATPYAGQTQTRTTLVANRAQTRRLAAWFFSGLLAPQHDPPSRPENSWTGIATPHPQPRPDEGRSRPRWGLAAVLLAAVLAATGVSWVLWSSASTPAPEAAAPATAPASAPTSSAARASSSATKPERAAAVAVPAVEGLSTRTAIDRLTTAGLKVNAVTSEHSARATGTALRTSPAAQDRVDRGSTVELFVASGTNIVPEVVGLWREDAVRALTSRGFSVTVVERPDGKSPGTVLESDAKAGSEQPVGTRVHLSVAEAPTRDLPSDSPTPETSTSSPDAPPPPGSQGRTTLIGPPTPTMTPTPTPNPGATP